MSNIYQSQVSHVISRIENLQRLELSASVHCSKANSLIRTFRQLPPFLTSPPPNFKVNRKFNDAINSILNSIDHLTQLCIQCSRESCSQFILMTTLHEVFERFLEIRQNMQRDLQTIGLNEAAELFVCSPDELLSQDQVDLKLIGIFIMQMRQRKDIAKRADIQEKINEQLKSLQRKGVKIDTNEIELGGVLTVPSLPANLNLVLEHEQLIFGDAIGSGRSGRVFKGKINGYPYPVAIKVLHCRQLTPSESEMLTREIFTLSTLNHPSFVKLLGYTNQPPYCLVTELLSNGSLFQFLKSHPDELTPTDRTVIAIDVARGMNYMHERNIIHRDLKSLNILLDNSKRARICDFGLVRLKSYAPMTGLIGTTQWMAPEILMCSTYYDVAADVYSYGIVLWELLTGEIPYNDVPTGEIPYLVVQEKLRPTIPKGTPSGLESLITSCWSQDPKERPPFSLIVNLFNNSKYHFPGTNAEELWKRVGGRRHKKPSASDPLKFIDPQNLGANNDSITRVQLGQVEQLMLKLSEAIKGTNYNLIDRYLVEVRSLYKSNLLTSTEFIPKVINLIKETKDSHSKLKIVKLMSEILHNSSLYKQFVDSNGLQLLYDLMRKGGEKITEAALIICADHIHSDMVSIDLIKALLVFNDSNQQTARLLALSALFRVIDLKFDFLCTMPTFIYHLLFFLIKPLPVPTFQKLLTVVSKFLDNIKTFSENILLQLIWLQTNVPPQLKSLAVECLTKALSFDSARKIFPIDFWKSIGRDFNIYKPVYQAFLHKLPPKFDELLTCLCLAAKDNIEALSLLVEYTKDIKCAKVIATKIPIQNLHSPLLLFQLYHNISNIDGVPLLIGDETEFYTVCKLVISSEFNSQTCQLIRKVELNPILLEETGLLMQIIGCINSSNDTTELFNLMSVIYSVSTCRFYQCFSYVSPKLTELLNSNDLYLKTGAFLCLANFSVYMGNINKFQLLNISANLVNKANSSTQNICVSYAKRFISTLSNNEVIKITQTFFENYKEQSTYIVEYANCLYLVIKEIPTIDVNIIMNLHRIIKK